MPAAVTEHASLSSKMVLSQSSSANLHDTDAQILQLWVEHGLSVGSRSAVLISKMSHHHTVAVDKKSSDTLPRLSTLRSPSNNLKQVQQPPVVKVVTPALARSRLRQLRREKRNQLKAKEEEARKKREEEEAAIRNAEQQRMAKKRAEVEAKIVAKKREQEAKEKLKKEMDAQIAKKEAEKKNSTTQENIPNPFQNAKSKEPSQWQRGKTESTEKVAGPVKKVIKDQEEKENSLPFVADAKKVWTDITNQSKTFREDASIKKPRMQLKKKINLAVNQISASVKQVSKKVGSLAEVVVMAQRMNRPDAEPFVFREIAERLIYEADGAGCLNLPTVYATAAVIVGITASVPKTETLRDVVLGQFFHHCIYTQATYPRAIAGESAADFRKRIGFKSEESFESYVNRVNGCMNLFSAVLQTELVIATSGINTKPNPFTLDMGWAWMARVLNTLPKTMTAPALFSFLDVAGYAMARRYGKQFAKLMPIIERVGVKNAVKKAPKVSTTRLQIFVEKYIRDGGRVMTVPKGRNLVESDAENRVTS